MQRARGSLRSSAKARSTWRNRHSRMQKVKSWWHWGKGSLWGHGERRRRSLHLGTSQFLHHEEGIISSFIVIVVIVRGGSSFCSLPQQAATSSRVKRIHHNGLSTFNLTSAERAALTFGFLPGGQTGCAHEVPTGLDLHVLVVLGTDFAQLERGAHLTV